MKYSVLVPTVNERNNLPIICCLLNETFTKEKLNYEIIVIDDASTDGTQEVCKELIKLYGEDKIILKTRSSKQGLGTAYIFGYNLQLVILLLLWTLIYLIIQNIYLK